jgi:hypothetical protein
MHKLRPLLSLFLRNPGESESWEIHNVKRVSIFFTVNLVPILDLFSPSRLIIDREKIELLRLAWTLARERQRFPVCNLFETSGAEGSDVSVHKTPHMLTVQAR